VQEQHNVQANAGTGAQQTVSNNSDQPADVGGVADDSAAAVADERLVADTPCDYNAAIRSAARGEVPVHSSAAVLFVYISAASNVKVFASPHFGRDVKEATDLMNMLVRQRDAFDRERHDQFVTDGTVPALCSASEMTMTPLSDLVGVAHSKLALLRKELSVALNEAKKQALKSGTRKGAVVEAAKQAGAPQR
jgi:hypothetical protein